MLDCDTPWRRGGTSLLQLSKQRSSAFSRPSACCRRVRAAGFLVGAEIGAQCAASRTFRRRCRRYAQRSAKFTSTRFSFRCEIKDFTLHRDRGDEADGFRAPVRGFRVFVALAPRLYVRQHRSHSALRQRVDRQGRSAESRASCVPSLAAPSPKQEKRTIAALRIGSFKVTQGFCRAMTIGDGRPILRRVWSQSISNCRISPRTSTAAYSPSPVHQSSANESSGTDICRCSRSSRTASSRSPGLRAQRFGNTWKIAQLSWSIPAAST